MKKILLSIFLMCIVLLTSSIEGASQTSYPLLGHPRLFFLSQDEAVLKDKLNSTPELKRVHDLIISESEKIIPLAVQERVLTGVRLLSVSREAIRRISYLSYAYRMTGDARFAARAETEMLAMAAFSNWNPSHFLDVGEMTLAMAIGYDWLYHYLGTSSRVAIATAIKTKGIAETTGSKSNHGWMTSDNNWNQVCNAGISAGVAAVYGEDPENYQPLIDRAVNSIKIPMGVYKYNGAYPEGLGYWDYGTSFNILFIDMLQRMWGTDRQLLEVDGFLSTVHFVNHMQGTATKQLSGSTLRSVMPQAFNFADNGSGIGVLPAMFWLTSQSPDKTVLYHELRKLSFALDNNESSLTGNRLLPFLLIWSRDLTFANLPAPSENTYLALGKSSVATMRTGWEANDIYLGLKGGTPSANHGHMDVGSFVMDAMDVRWAMDFGASSYNALESNGVNLWNMSQTSGRWDVFRYNNMAHNTLTFNGKKQLVAGNAPVQNLVNTPDLKSAEVNLTSLYQNDVSHCKRTAAIVQDRYVEITDVITAGSNPVTVRWNLLTQAVPQRISDRVIRLTQATKQLYLIFEGSGQVEAKAWSTKPSTSYEESNSGTYFTGYEFTVAAGETRTISVKLVPDGDPLLDGMDLSTFGQVLNEDFENFNLGSLSSGFVSWRTNPASDGSMKAILGEVVVNPFKGGINQSNKVLRIQRQDDSQYITSANSGSVTYRGVQAFGYDLRVNSSSVVEFKYYKNAQGKLGVRIYDGNTGNFLLMDYTDPYETLYGYSTAQWRTAQFAVGTLNLSNFTYTASGYLLISPERNGNEIFQETELVMYVDDVKMLPLSTAVRQIPQNNMQFTAFYDAGSNRICVVNLPQDTRVVRLFDIMGRKLHEVDVFGDRAMLDAGQSPSSVFVVQVQNDAGLAKSVKVVR